MSEINLTLPGSATANALTLPANLDFEEWQGLIKGLSGVRNASKWYIGDAIIT